jgi:deaminated glutathione amidase
MERFVAAVVQMSSGPDRGANLRGAEALVRGAVGRGARLVVLPEVFAWRGADPTDPASAEPIPGPTTEAMAALARELSIFLCMGSILEAVPNESRRFNTSCLLDPAGTIVARYRKMHLFDVALPGRVAVRESASRLPGDTPVTIRTPLATLGCSICYDLRFPDLFQALAEKGAEIIALPAAFTMQTGKDHWEVLLRARAIETETYVCASAQTGSFTVGNEQRQTYGHSLVADPWGHVVAKASDGVGIVSARLDPALVKRVRGLIPVAEHKVRIARS